ncbi:PDZ domain-containing protein [Pseudonocardia broussonetiae]|uniref:PDZ domain-containing protein n=1 Tax=Pseudonocardia broussonetiae TaxID=2736640 RepID=A0A6M6JD83_9PSEU|nr:PDZ domain-containing protein [Pseudonocardia broussonetiae]QJY44867.1 PDZ domain-containing protein [Pseudonocardia broussonetiae]
MSRRPLTAVAAALLAVSLGVIGATLPVPFVALGPGPTHDTLGDYEGTQIVRVEGLPQYPTTGHLNMTTVSVTDRLSLFTTLWFWASGERRVIPRESVFPSDRTDQEIQDENAAQFASSESNAEAAAVTELGLPARVLVAGVVADSPAAGVLEAGDEIVSVAGQPVASAAEVSDRLTDARPGDTVAIDYRREGTEQQVDVVLGASPDRAQGFLGVRPTVEARDGAIDISLDGIGGPSAGLMFSLAVVDRLTPGELTGGRFIAGTGSIDPSGAVGAIDGVPFKMAKASEVGAEVFLVPDANCAEAVSTAPDGLDLIRVTTLDDAIDQLDALRAGRPTAPC